MFERYTKAARRLLFVARSEASQTAASFIEPEHLLLALLREESSLLRRLLPRGAAKSMENDIWRKFV